MKKYLITLVLLLNVGSSYSHCQVPCGIYDDVGRILMIQEDFKTIKKAMDEIKKLSENKDGQSFNQLNRWISTKEEHSTNIQRIISDYFLTQRVKSENKNYENHLKFLHQTLVYAMKCKQTINPENVMNGLIILDNFAKIYFDEHDLEHLKQLSE